MSEFTRKNSDTVVSSCRENAGAIGRALAAVIEGKFQVEFGELRDWNAEALAADDGSGLAFLCQVGEQGAILLIPHSLVPERYRNPGEAEKAELEMAAAECCWSMLPREFRATRFEALTLEDFSAEVQGGKPAEWARMLEVRLVPAAPEPPSEDELTEAELAAAFAELEAEKQAAAESESATAESSDAEAGSDTEQSDQATQTGEDAASEPAAPEAKDEEQPAKEPVDPDADADKQDEAVQGDTAPDEEAPDDDPNEVAEDETVQDETGENAVADEDSAAQAEEQTDQVNEEATASEPLGSCYLIWPLINPPFPILADSQDDEEVARAEEEEQNRQDLLARFRRMKTMPVPVIVELASKKIEIGQLRQLTPGSLVTFTKSCEDLLDLYVNNYLFCRGEAVKIGEKFGLKINEVGAEEIRERRVLNPP